MNTTLYYDVPYSLISGGFRVGAATQQYCPCVGRGGLRTYRRWEGRGGAPRAGNAGGAVAGIAVGESYQTSRRQDSPPVRFSAGRAVAAGARRRTRPHAPRRSRGMPCPPGRLRRQHYAHLLQATQGRHDRQTGACALITYCPAIITAPKIKFHDPLNLRVANLVAGLV